jgi:DNA-directed RNA polymerase specialized sigma24 family protein
MTIQSDDMQTERSPFRESFEAFYAREIRAVVGLAVVLSGNGRAAEDLAQEAFLAAYRNWSRVGSYEDPAAWVRRVVSNQAVSRFRRIAAETRALLRLGGESFVVPASDPEAIYVWREVRRLPTRQAQVIALKYYDQQSISGIAEVLGCSEATVKTHLRRARETLARRLDAGDFE